MKRVVVLGEPGSGKSTLALQLGQVLKVRVVHLDRVFWQPGWQEPDPDHFRQQHDACASGDRWIIEGMYWKTIDFRLERADTVIWLDVPVGLRLYRVFRRTLRTLGRVREDLAPGCPEKWDLGFYRYILTGRAAREQRVAARLKLLGPEKQVFVLRSAGQVKRFLQDQVNRLA